MSGNWYIEVDCARCGEPIPLGKVPSPEEEPELKFRTVANVPCAACGYTDSYAPVLMSRRPPLVMPVLASYAQGRSIKIAANGLTYFSLPRVRFCV
jgi:hypothetical protein